MVYPENPDWDSIHTDRAVQLLGNHPEWSVRRFMLSGCTRNRINIDVISDDPSLSFIQVYVDGLHVVVAPIHKIILKEHPEIEDVFHPLPKTTS